MIINLGSNSTSGATSKVALLTRIGKAFFDAYDSTVNPKELSVAFIDDVSMFSEFQHWLSLTHGVSVRFINVGTSYHFIIAIEFIEDDFFTTMLLKLPQG